MYLQTKIHVFTYCQTYMSLATAATQVEQSRFVEGTHIQTCHPRPALANAGLDWKHFCGASTCAKIFEE